MLVPALALCGALAIAPPAVSATAPNDLRESAQAIAKLPATVEGTTVASSVQIDEAAPPCVSATSPPVVAPGPAPTVTPVTSGSVWFQVTSPEAQRMFVRLQARGDLDAVIDVVRRSRSQLIPEGCGVTDEDGQVLLSISARANAVYLIRVSQRANSAAGTFRLDVFSPLPAPRPPGPQLPRAGAGGALDGLVNNMDAWSMRLKSGITYRVNLAVAPGKCLRLDTYRPGTNSFRGGYDRRMACGGYRLLTPDRGRGGRYSFVVGNDSDTRAARSYRLTVAPVTGDDVYPGKSLRNHSSVSAKLDARRGDRVDVYHFSVSYRGHLILGLRTADDNAFNVRLLTDTGRRVGCACGERGSTELRRGVRAGRYVVLVEARGRSAGAYRLSRVARIFTRTTLTANGQRAAEVGPGSSVRLGLSVTPTANGLVDVRIERFDAATGWHYHRTLTVRVAGGSGSATFLPPALGSWRAEAQFRGTTTEAPSNTRQTTRIRVVEPLES